MARLSLIAAVAGNGAIGKEQDLLCHLPNDLKHFKTLTLGHTIIMGRKTFESLPKGALPNRENIGLSRRKDALFPGAKVFHSLQDAISKYPDNEELFIIGGATLYKETIGMAENLYITHIHHIFDDADTFFPAIDTDKWEETERTEMPADDRHPYSYCFTRYRRKML